MLAVSIWPRDQDGRWASVAVLWLRNAHCGIVECESVHDFGTCAPHSMDGFVTQVAGLPYNVARAGDADAARGNQRLVYVYDRAYAAFLYRALISRCFSVAAAAEPAFPIPIGPKRRFHNIVDTE